ncbi:hypothetical protein H5410_031024 [Solanum commersonii]|uniref:Uncharacterized protein n=1 Tax=Solanum commersonii TaxID=4109 RepID=A0A9J5YL28_SOLCO|nr:hypothetical protein H5410_031024 [Solanum commersonii]
MIFPKKRDGVGILLSKTSRKWHSSRLTQQYQKPCDEIEHVGCPNNEDGWHLFLTHLTGNHIQWRLPWVHGRALLRTNHVYFIELIRLEGFRPYAPLRVL